MSQDYHQGIFSFASGFVDRGGDHQQDESQIRRDKLRLPGFEAPPPHHPLVGIDPPQGAAAAALHPGVYETAGMLSEMFNFAGGAAPLGGGGSLVEHQSQQISGAESAAAAMQLFLTNPPPRSPSPPPHHHQPPPPPTHMLLPSQGFHSIPQQPQFTWVPDGGGGGEGQRLSLSLSSNLEAAKVEEELRIGGGGMMFFTNQEMGVAPSSSSIKNYAAQHNQNQHVMHLQGYGLGHGQVSFGFGSSFGSASSVGAVNVLRNSKYTRPAQELLEEFCSVGRGHLKKSKFTRNNSINTSATNAATASTSGSGGAGPSSSNSTKDPPPMSPADRMEHQRRKVKLLSMLDEVERRYSHYCEQMQMVVSSFDMVMGFGAAIPYTALAQKAMSRHFRCLKDAIQAQLKHSCELLGEKDVTASTGLTKGETPRLKMLEQSLRQQRAFHQMGMMEQEAWRPQRGLPERSVNILRAWLFEHFLHPYPSDADKHLLARQTGLSRNQVSNWFINARVRLWKPMVEEMYQQEAKDNEDQDDDEEEEGGNIEFAKRGSNIAQTSMHPAQSSAASAATTTTTTAATLATAKRSEINASENDPSFFAVNNTNPTRHSSDTQLAGSGRQPPPQPSAAAAAAASQAAISHVDACSSFGTIMSGAAHHHHHENSMGAPTMIRFGTMSTASATAGDISLTLGLRHSAATGGGGGNPSEKSAFSFREFGS